MGKRGKPMKHAIMSRSPLKATGTQSSVGPLWGIYYTRKNYSTDCEVYPFAPTPHD